MVSFSRRRLAAVSVLAGLAAAPAVAQARATFTLAPGAPYAVEGPATSVAYSPGGGMLASTAVMAGTATVYTVDRATAALTPMASVGDGGPTVSAAFGPRGRLLAVGNANGRVGVFSVRRSRGTVTPVTGSPFATRTRGSSSVAFSPSGDLLAAAGGGNRVAMFTVAAGTGVLTRVKGSPFPAGMDTRSLAFSPSGALLAVTDQSGQVRMFKVSDTGHLKATNGRPATTGSGAGPTSATFSPSGGLLAVANSNAATFSVFAVNQTTGKLSPVAGSPFVDPGADAVAFNPAGNLLAALDNDAIAFYSVNATTDTIAPSPIAPVADDENSEFPIALAWSPRGGYLASANEGIDGFYTTGEVNSFKRQN